MAFGQIDSEKADIDYNTLQVSAELYLWQSMWHQDTQIDLEMADIDYNTLQIRAELYLWQSMWHQDTIWQLDLEKSDIDYYTVNYICAELYQ